MANIDVREFGAKPKGRKILRWRKDTGQFDTLDPDGIGQWIVTNPTAVQMQKA